MCDTSKMAASLYIVAITTLFSLAAGQAIPANCTQEGACKCTFKNGGIIDLGKISGIEDDDTAWKKDIEPTLSSIDYVYSYKPCYDFNEDGTVGGNCNNVASCQKAKGKTDQYSLGTSASAKFMKELGEIKLAADPDSSGTIRETWVTLKCADSDSFAVTGQISGTNPGSAKYLTIRSHLLPCRWRALYDVQTRRRGRRENSKFDLLERSATDDKRWRLFFHLTNHEEERIFKSVIAVWHGIRSRNSKKGQLPFRIQFYTFVDIKDVH